MDTRHVTIGERTVDAEVVATMHEDQPVWIGRSRSLADAYALAVAAHGERRRPSDDHLFIEHVTEVGELLQSAGYDDELVAVGLLHDSVERGTLDYEKLRGTMGASICALVRILSEDPRIESFERRKAGLRRQVEGGGGLAVTVYAADKLSDIRGLRRGIAIFGDGLAERLGTGVADMTAHYRESVQMIESVKAGSIFLPQLRLELVRLGDAEKREPSALQR